MESLEQLRFIVWVRESGSIWGYATFLFLHTFGLATVAGVSAGLGLRVLGFAPAMPLAPMKRLYPIMWGALAITIISGTVLLMTDTSKALMPVFIAKITFVILAVVMLRLLYARLFNDPQADTRPIPSNARGLAVASLLFWVGATTAGRLMAYLASGI